MVSVADFSSDAVGRMMGATPPGWFVSDGCTAVPDCLPGYYGGTASVALACLFHDWAAHCGGSERDRLVHDLYFLANMITLGASPDFAAVYFRGVRWAGPFSRGRGWTYKPRVGFLRRVWYSLKAFLWF